MVVWVDSHIALLYALHVRLGSIPAVDILHVSRKCKILSQSPNMCMLLEITGIYPEIIGVYLGYIPVI